MPKCYGMEKSQQFHKVWGWKAKGQAGSKHIENIIFFFLCQD